MLSDQNEFRGDALGDLSLPFCLVRANDDFAEAFVVTNGAVSSRCAELLSLCEGPVLLGMPVDGWTALRMPIRFMTLEHLPPGTAIFHSLAAETIQSGIRGVLGGRHGTLPNWIQCVVTRPGGVLAHWAPIEAAHELVQRNTTVKQCAVLRRLRLPSGKIPTFDHFENFARQHSIPCVNMFDYCQWRRKTTGPCLISLPAAARLPIRHGTFTMRIFENPWTGRQHVAMIMGDLDGPTPALVRMHSECFTGDIMGSLRCDCGPQLDAALARVAREGRGAVLYLRQEGRGIGLYEKMRAYVAQDSGLDTVEANQVLGFPPDLRTYGEAAEMLRVLGVSRVKLLTNNPLKMAGLAREGMEVVGREPLIIEPNAENEGYLETKRIRMGHMLLPLDS